MTLSGLMIGDWVLSKSDDKIYKINSIITQDDGTILLATEDGLHFDYMYEPIPLTAEILEKNGFERNPLWHHCDKDLDDYSISVQLGYANRIEYIEISEKGKDNVIPSERTKMYLTNIKYVHQLQHALRLCGIEKEIEL